MTTNQQGVVPKALRPVEPGALAASIQELEDWENRADDERLTPSEGESVILVLHELKRLRALSAASQPVVPAVAHVPPQIPALIGDVAMAHEQCRAVVHFALALAEVYSSKAAIVVNSNGARLADQIGYASAQALEWMGDELNATDATTEDDEWVNPIIDAAQERWPAAVPTGAMESVLIDGVAHQTPTPVAADLLRLHMELLQARQHGAAFAARPVRDLTDADMDRLITLVAQHDRDEIGHQGLVEAVVREFTVLRSPSPEPTFQARVQPWLLQCFGAEIAADTMERNHRYFEESTELVQANGMTRSEAHQLVDYTYNRPVGELKQEVGGAMVTLAALCLSRSIDMHSAGETELARIWTKVEAIRAKQAAKPKHSPLPESAPPTISADGGKGE